MRGAYNVKSTTTFEPLDTFSDDQARRAALVLGSKLYADALKSGVGPQDLVWSHTTGAPLGAWGVPHRYPEALAQYREREAYADSLRVRRDPCTYCGTRTDIGCKHTVAA